MKYGILAQAYAQIEATSSRLQMTRLLADLLRLTPKEQIARVAYLTQGKLYPDFAGIEIGVAEKLAVRAVAAAAGMDEGEVARRLGRLGDLGTVAEGTVRRTGRRQTLTVDEVYRDLDAAARATGKGAQRTRLERIAGLLRKATPREARYLVRTVTGRLRLGVGDMTVLDALAAVFLDGTRGRAALERAYNLTSDLGFVAQTAATGGAAAIRKIHVVVGKPIRPMLAERLGEPQQILAKLGGRCAAEYKYDGERLQIHKRQRQVHVYSRRVEEISTQYPDVVELVRTQVRAASAILEGEVVAVDPETGDLRSFQDLMPRRRKYGIQEAMEAIPAALYAFDALFADGRDLTEQPYHARRAVLQRIVKPVDRFRVAHWREIGSAAELEAFFEQAVQDGAEGLMCKASGGVYHAGARGWLWIKFKREYRSEMTDTVDLVVVGAFHGRGRRGGTYGALLMAAFDREADLFRTVCKVGSGFTDEDLAALPGRLSPHRVAHRPARVHSRLEPDVWFEPALVLEVIGAEITLSPVHTAGWDLVRQGSGLAIRFPRVTRYRDDRGPEDATAVREVVAMYRRRLKRTA